MQVEHVPRERLPARRAAQQQRHLAVGVGVLGEVVVHAERVAPAVEKYSPIAQPANGAIHLIGAASAAEAETTIV